MEAAPLTTLVEVSAVRLDIATEAVDNLAPSVRGAGVSQCTKVMLPAPSTTNLGITLHNVRAPTEERVGGHLAVWQGQRVNHEPMDATARSAAYPGLRTLNVCQSAYTAPQNRKNPSVVFTIDTGPVGSSHVVSHCSNAQRLQQAVRLSWGSVSSRMGRAVGSSPSAPSPLAPSTLSLPPSSPLPAADASALPDCPRKRHVR